MCQHGWELKPGQDCPDCLWDEAASRTTYQGRDAVAIVIRAVASAASSLASRQDREKILQIAEQENNYKAIKVAREMHRKERGL